MGLGRPNQTFREVRTKTKFVGFGPLISTLEDPVFLYITQIAHLGYWAGDSVMLSLGRTARKLTTCSQIFIEPDI